MEIVVATAVEEDGSAVEKNGFIVELWNGDQVFAEVLRVAGKPECIIYPRRDNKPWQIPMAELQSDLAVAVQKL